MTGAAEGKSESETAIVTAGLLLIGDEILSGRTKDKNIGFTAEYLTAIGIDLKEVRVVPDEQPEICLLYTSPSPRDGLLSRMPSSA